MPMVAEGFDVLRVEILALQIVPDLIGFRFSLGYVFPFWKLGVELLKLLALIDLLCLGVFFLPLTIDPLQLSVSPLQIRLPLLECALLRQILNRVSPQKLVGENLRLLRQDALGGYGEVV